MPPDTLTASPVRAPTAPPLPSGWEREDDCEDGRHRYYCEPVGTFDRVYVSWWPEPAGHGSVVVVGPLYATAPLDALLAYLRALTPEQVTSQPAPSGGAS